MDSLEQQPEKAASVVHTRKRTSTPVKIVTAVVCVAVATFLFGSALFIYQQSSSQGLPFLSGQDEQQVLPGVFGNPQSGSNQPFAHQNGPCTSCHNSVNPQGKLYVAIDGRDITDNPSVRVEAGGAFELTFHFEGMLGDPKKRTGTGVEIVVPGQTIWSVGPGTGRSVDGWSAGGSGRSLWSPAWSRGDAGAGPRGALWKHTPSQPTAYYLDFSGTSWAVPNISAAAIDNGGDGDGDGKTSSMGSDALVGVPLKQQAGTFEIDLVALGSDAAGNPAQLTRRISVQVDPAPTGPNGGPVSKTPFRAFHAGKAACGSCHTGGKAVPANHKDQSNETCIQCHVPAMAGQPLARVAPPPAAPIIAHSIQERDDCVSCHGAGGLRPAPADHAGRPGTSCTLCHQTSADPGKKPAQIPHPLDDRKDCVSCHSSTVIPSVPADHARRDNAMCTVCHPKADTRATSAPPDVPHATDGGRADCLTCHARGMLGSAEKSHEGFAVDDSNCAGCHKPVAQVDVPGRAPNTPHQIDGRSNCVACHGSSGIRPVPADHAGRPNAACTGCHPVATDRTGTAPKTPHPVAGREACLTCHSGPMIPLIPDDHKGRTNDSCSACHKERKS